MKFPFFQAKAVHWTCLLMSETNLVYFLQPMASNLSHACNMCFTQYEPLVERPTTIVAGPNLVDCPRRAMTVLCWLVCWWDGCCDCHRHYQTWSWWTRYLKLTNVKLQRGLFQAPDWFHKLSVAPDSRLKTIFHHKTSSARLWAGSYLRRSEGVDTHRDNS